ncbi:DUF3999 family protein [Paenibacillus albidus]|uniref:DUF3999 family protein n=1 Tax=Paenibacillus albidus TaxID=2041023 RepID=UPI001BE9E9AF|nr:DUF3999 family protein [Paenibacillus albidus]MBT2290187.1 DUF3999 family protein [Paenibacillus albidus]
MKIKSKILQVSLAVLFLSGLGFPLPDIPAAAAESVESYAAWRFSKPIEAGGDVPYHALYLDEDVYREAAEDLSDLRIVDGQGKTVPFYMDNGETVISEYTTAYASKLVHTANQKTAAIFDYKITPARENTDIVGNKLVFELPEEAFLKHVQVFGSYDGNVWEPLLKADLYATDGLEQNSIELGAAYKFGYYRLRVENNIEQLAFDKLELRLNSQEVKKTDYKREQTPEYTITQKGNETHIIVDNGNRLNISKVLLDSTGNFSRKYKLLDESGQPVGTADGDELYRLDFKDAKITATDIIPLQLLRSRVFTVVIENNDDAPLRINKVHTEYFVDKLVFAADTQGPYKLLYGNPQASAPQYDIAHFKDYIESGTLNLALLGTQNTAREASVGTAAGSGWLQSKTGFNIIIVTVSLLLIIVLIRKMNQTRT